MTEYLDKISQSYEKDYEKSFTPRELDILACNISGRTSRKSIASTLNISTATVASFMRGIMQKLECSSWEYVRKYIENENLVEVLREHFKNHISSNTQDFNKKPSLQYLRIRDGSQAVHRTTIIKTILYVWLKYIQPRWFTGLFLLAVCMIILLSIAKSENNYIRSEVILPEKQYLLERNGLINEIKNALIAKRRDNTHVPVVTLAGIGGAGKTTVARMIAQQHKGLTWEINAENKTSLIASFRKLAYYIATSRQDKERIEFIQRMSAFLEQDLQLLFFIKDKLRSFPGWLLIFDNIESFDEIQEYFPVDSSVWGRGAVIITTRNETLKMGFQIKISELTKDESLKLFCLTTHRIKVLAEPEKDELYDFLQSVPPYPLDISVAGHYLWVTNTSREEYLKNFDKKNQNLMIKKTISDAQMYKQTREEILNLTLTRLLKENPHFLGLLVVISSLDSQNIPINMCKSFESLETVQDFIQELKKASLITVSTQHSEKKLYIFIHRTIQAYIFTWLNNTNLVKKQALEKEVSRLVGLLEKKIHEYLRIENYDGLVEIYPHVKKLLATPGLADHDKNILFAANFCLKVDFEQHSISDIDAMRAVVNQLNNDSTSYRVLFASSYFGTLLCHSGRYKEAVSTLEKCLDLLYKNYPDSIEYYRALRALGVNYRIIGKYREAGMCFETCKKIYELFPFNSREKAELIAQNGLILRDTGKYLEAQKLLKESVDIIAKNASFLEKVLQPYFWLQTNNLELGYYKNFNVYQAINVGITLFVDKQQIGYQGVCEYHLGRYMKALEILEKTYRSELASGYIQNYNSFKGYTPILGKTYIHFKRYEEARSVLETCLKYAEQLYGRDKFQNARIICYLGDLELAEGRVDLAESKMLHAYKLLKDVDHTDMYIPLESLADLYKQKLEKAKKDRNIEEQEKCFAKFQKYLTAANKIIHERFPADSDHVKRITKKLKEF